MLAPLVAPLNRAAPKIAECGMGIAESGSEASAIRTPRSAIQTAPAGVAVQAATGAFFHAAPPGYAYVARLAASISVL